MSEMRRRWRARADDLGYMWLVETDDKHTLVCEFNEARLAQHVVELHNSWLLGTPPYSHLLREVVGVVEEITE